MSLRVWLPLTKDLRNQGLDDVTVTNNGATFDANGKLGGCYSFDGSHYLQSNKQIGEGWKEITFACWVYLNETVLTSGSWYRILGIGAHTRAHLDIASDNTLRLFVSQTGTTSGLGVYSTTIGQAGKWYHLCGVLGNNYMSIYINGLKENEKVIDSSSITYTNADYFRIGSITSGNAFNGKISDVRVYDHALSSLEVKEISKGLILHYPLNRNGWGQENLLPNSELNGSWEYPSTNYKDQYSPVTVSVPTGSAYTLSFDAKSTVNGDKIRTHYYSPNTTTTCTSSQGIVKTASDGNMDFTLSTQWKRYWVVYNQNETSAVKHIICPRMVSGQGTGVVSVKKVKLEEGSIATPWCPNSSDTLATIMGLNDNIEYDTSGYGNNGIRTGIFNWTSDTPKYQVSSVFDSSSIIDTPVIITSTSLISQYTAAVWIKRNNIDTTNNHCFFTGPIELFVQGSTSHIRFYWSHATSTSSMVNNTWDPSVTINNSIWTHIVVTFADGVLKCYINGELSNTSDRSSTGQYIYGNKYHTIGSYHDTTEKFIGQICDVRAYATALSAEDVKSLYNNSAYIDNQGNIYGAVYEEV